MKKIFIYTFMGLFVFLVLNSCKNQKNLIPVKSMRIVYNTNLGEVDTVYYDNYGHTVVYVVNGSKGRQVSIITDTAMYFILDNEKVVIREKSNFDSVRNLIRSTIDSIKKSKRFKKVGSEKIWGYKCDVYEGDSGMIKFWIWKDAIILKNETNLNFFGQNILMTTQAVEIQKDITIPQSLLQIPKNYPVMSLQEYQTLQMERYFQQQAAVEDSMPNLDSLNLQVQQFVDSLKQMMSDTMK